jgi:hypothetical protein
LLQILMFLLNSFVLASAIREGDGTLSRGDAGASFRWVYPSETDSSITQWQEPHLVAIPGKRPFRDTLCLFFAGSYGVPGSVRLLQEQLASCGYRSIDLRYPNSWTTPGLCGDSPDSDCYDNFRMEVLDGIDRSEKIDVSSSECIENRVRMALRYLNRTWPGEGWDAYLQEDSTRWERITVIGHSQGAGVAAFIGKIHALARVTALSGPNDFSSVFNLPAPWLSMEGATPEDRYFTFGHLKDEYYSSWSQTWLALGLGSFGPLEDFSSDSPWFTSHTVVTNLDIPGAEYHSGVIADVLVPKTQAGTSVFEEALEYVCAPGGYPRLSPPTGLRATISVVDGRKGFLLQWNNNSVKAKETAIERKSAEQDSFVQVAAVAREVTEWYDGTATNGVYAYRVKARNALLDSSPSETAQVDLTGISLRGRERITEKAIQLDPVYPNPFSAEMEVGFTLPVGGAVSIKVVDTLGRERGVIFRGGAEAGYHSLRWTPTDLGSGVYFVVLTTAHGVAVRKTMMVK